MTKRFDEYVNKNNRLFIPFIMTGDPTPEITIEIALTLQKAGASCIELGIPYTDPLADGPVIQAAASRALKHGMTLEKALKLVPKMRERGLKIPVIAFTYYNPLMQFGEERFIEEALKHEVDGLLVPDLPHEESGYVEELCRNKGLKYISLVAPTSKERIARIAKNAQGFLYCVSSLGVTGTRDHFADNVYEFLADVNKHATVPVAVGFGISKREQVQALSEYCDGIIVGSAIIKEVARLEEQLLNEAEREDALLEIKRFVLSLISS